MTNYKSNLTKKKKIKQKVEKPKTVVDIPSCKQPKWIELDER